MTAREKFQIDDVVKPTEDLLRQTKGLKGRTAVVRGFNSMKGSPMTVHLAVEGRTKIDRYHMKFWEVVQRALAVLLVVLVPQLVGAAPVTVEWDEPTDGVTRGYEIAFGTAPGIYSQAINVGYTTSTILSLPDGVTYYIAVRAYSEIGKLSAFSEEVSVTVGAGPAKITLAVTTARVKNLRNSSLTWSGAVGTSVDLYRNGVLVLTIPNDGEYLDQLRRNGTYRYKVCVQAVCSNEVLATF